MEELISDTSQQNKYVPIVSVSNAVEETNQMIQQMRQSLLPLEGIKQIDSILSVYKVKIDSIIHLMKEDSVKSTGFRDIERRDVALNQYKSVLTEFNQQLQSEIEKLNDDSEEIQQLDQIWENTKSIKEFQEVSQTIQDEINALAARIKNEQKKIQDQINNYLEIQIEINQQISRIQEMLDNINREQQIADRKLLTRSAPPIWKIIGAVKRTDGSQFELTNLIQLRKNDILTYYMNNKTRFYLALLYLLLFQIFFYYLKSLIHKTEFEKELDVSQNTALKFLKKNWLTGLVLGLVIAYVTLPNKPRIIENLLLLVSLLPLYYLFAHAVDKKYYLLIRLLFLLFFLTLFVEGFREVAIIRRFFMLGLNLLMLTLLITLTYKKWTRLFKSNFIASGSRLTTKIFIGFLIISVLANIWGSFRFSIYVTYAVTGSIFYGLLVYLIYLIIVGMTAAFLFSRSAGKLSIVKNFRYEIEHRIAAGSRFILVIAYLILLFRSFDVLKEILQFIENILKYPFHIGNITFTIGDILLFILILMIARWISRFIVFILNEQVYYKTRKKKDMAASVSALVSFTIITIGFLIGVMAIGFELDKLTILISAFGVGIGFGLQNIFNNLVSGIIMVFERPLQVGDVIEVGQLIGTVKSIGIRSSTVRTFDGSEVIVPNGNLISNELINWTHSDMQRRLIIQVGVAYGTNPEKVIELLENVALENPNIMDNPKPYALFTEFADSSLNFELRCWTDNFDDWLTTISNLRVSVNQVLAEAGITIPFPQRDVHLFQAEATSPKKSSPRKK
jgi:small-conductance mechanosensitive channel